MNIIVNIITLPSMLSTHIFYFVYGYRDSELTNPLSLTLHIMCILSVSQATCFSSQFHLSSLFTSLTFESKTA